MNRAALPTRRPGTQARAKVTVQKILDAARDLIAERGAADATMTEIAQRADVVLGTVYQYFKDRSAIHKAILVHHNADLRLILLRHLEAARDVPTLCAALDQAFREYYLQHQRDPFFNGIWSIVQTDADLQRIDLEDTLQNARQLQSLALRFLPNADEDRLLAACALLLQISLSASRFGRAVPPALAESVPDLFARMIETTFSDFEVSRPAPAA